jgi:hypothetical protein
MTVSIMRLLFTVALLSIPTTIRAKDLPMAESGAANCINWTSHLSDAHHDGGYLMVLLAAGLGHLLETGFTFQQIFSWIDRYCLTHPSEPLADTVAAFARKNAR